MALVAKTLGQVVRYVSNSDPAKGTPNEAAEATVFLLAPLSSRQMAAIQDATTVNRMKPAAEGAAPDAPAEVESNVRTLERCYLYAQTALRGWENFPDPSGDAVAFHVANRIVGGERVAGASDAAMNRLDVGTITDIGVEVHRISQPEPAALKS